MVVAEDGAARVGQTVELVVVSSLQTSAGRLIFARLANPEAPGVAADASVPDPSDAGTANASVDAGSRETAAPMAADVSHVAEGAAGSVESGASGGDVSEKVAGEKSAEKNGAGAIKPVRSPFPPRAPASPRQGTPRNPRR
jgi:hypothetical protein